LVALSRVVLGVHFPTDTLMGALIGSTMALLAFEFGLPLWY
jgi:undecaprenyl-diphosphatase